VPRGPKQKEGRVRGGRGGCAGGRREVVVQFQNLRVCEFRLEGSGPILKKKFS
jgi:hypothetical protein